MKSTCIYILILWVLQVWQDRVDCYAIGPWKMSSDYLSLARDRKDIIVTIIILPSHWIYRNVLALDLNLVRQLSEALVAFVPPVSIEDRLLLWMVVRSLTYYLEHILLMWAERLVNLLLWVLALFGLLRVVLGGGLSTILKPGLKCWGLGV
jgi:hypothetical protein